MSTDHHTKETTVTTCICAEMGATGFDQRHALCTAHTITFTAEEVARLALPFDLNAEPEHFRSYVREMLDSWDTDGLYRHIAAMIRRNALHDDPGCLDTAHVAARLLGITDEEAGLA